MKVALASLPFPGTIKGALVGIEDCLAEAKAAQADIVCTPENYLPGLRNVGFPVDPVDQQEVLAAVDEVGRTVRRFGVALILGVEFPSSDGSLISSLVFNKRGRVIGRQDKVQLDPSENRAYVEGKGRSLFEIDGVRFGIAICHEAWRYPETVRWAAWRGAKLVFVPHLSLGAAGGKPSGWADPNNSFHEKAAMCRAAENSIYIAIVNYAIAASETTSAIIKPDGSLLAFQPYGKPGLLVEEVALDLATGFLASRFRPEDNQELIC